MSRIPYIDNSIFRNRNEMRWFSFAGVSFVDIHRSRHKHNITNKVFMRQSNMRLGQMPHFYYGLLLFVVFAFTTTSDGAFVVSSSLLSFRTSSNLVVKRRKIPNNDLSVYATDGSFENVGEGDDVLIWKIHYQNIRIERSSGNCSSFVEFEVFDHAHSY